MDTPLSFKKSQKRGKNNNKKEKEQLEKQLQDGRF